MRSEWNGVYRVLCVFSPFKDYLSNLPEPCAWCPLPEQRAPNPIDVPVKVFLCNQIGPSRYCFAGALGLRCDPQFLFSH